MKNRELIKRATTVASPLLFLSLLSCSGGEEQSRFVQGTSDSKTEVALPQAMQRASFPSNGTVSAFVTVDPNSGGTRKTMSISASTASFNTQVSAGEHEFLFELFYDSPSISQTVPLVTARKSITVAASGTTTLGFTEKDYTYLNSDASDTDFYTNVREIEKGSDPFDSSSVPDDLDDNYEDNDTEGQAYDVNGLELTMLDGTSSTGQGFLVAEGSILDPVDFYSVDITSTKATLNFQYTGSNASTFGVIYYYNSSGAQVVADVVTQVDTLVIRQTFNNPPQGKYYIAFITDEDQDFDTTGDYVNGGYAFQWWSTE